MAGENKSSIFWVGKDQYTFTALVESAKKSAHDQPGSFWPRLALVLLRRIHELEKESQVLRHGDLFITSPAVTKAAR